jgi:hypothetical protein
MNSASVMPRARLASADAPVRHRTTGATWATYRYESTDDAGTSLTENAGRAGEGHHPTAAELRPHAVALLRRLTQQQAKRRPSWKAWS